MRAIRASDLLWAALLFGGTVLYVGLQPPNLGPADESVYLYQAKRVMEGAVPYRDFFDLATPGWLYVMAGLFKLFGVSVVTARMSTAVLHGLTAVMIYATCRRLGVRPGLSWPAGLAYLVVSQPAWPIASQHWLATWLSVLLLLICAGRPAAHARWAVWPGLVAGGLIAVHQQRGVVIALGAALWLVVDHALRRRDPAAPPPVLPRLAWFAAGGALVLVPLFGGLIAAGGYEPVWQALVLHPLTHYRSTTWGQSSAILAQASSYTFPVLLKYLPLVLVPHLLRFGARLASGQRTPEVHRLALLIVFGAAALLSIFYYPDYIHIAFIAPVFFVAAAELAERYLGPLAERSLAVRSAGWVAGGVLLAASALRLGDNHQRTRASYPVERDTAFGRVSFARPIEAELYDLMRERMDGLPSRELFCYPIFSYLYLMLDADNPTRYQYLLPRNMNSSRWTGEASSPEQIREVVQVLEERRLPYVVVLPGFLEPDDPVMAYLRRDYEPLTDAGTAGQAIYRRKPSAPPPNGPPG